MKILFCVSSMGSGGAERVASTLANGWIAEGHEVILVPLYSGRGQCFYELAHGVRLVFLADLVGSTSRLRLLAYIQRVLALRSFIRQEAPDRIVSFLTNVNIMTLFAGLWLKTRTVVCERTDPFTMPLPRSLRMLRALLYPLASALVVQTRAVAEKYRTQRRLLPRIWVIGNPVPESFVTGPMWSTSLGPVQRLIAVGRLDENKGFDRVIGLFPDLSCAHPNWVLRIVGDGPQKRELENLVERLGLAERVQFLPPTSDLKGELLRSELFVLASRFEGFPNVLLEAMAVGMPCVAVDCPSGPREITLDGEAAVLVPAGDDKALHSALDSAMGDRQLREALSKTARASVQERFSLAKILAEWSRVLN